MGDSSSSQPEPFLSTSQAYTESITTKVVKAMTEVTGTKPATPLYEAINPDALESLYQHAAPEVTFEYIGYSVTIHPDQTITVSELNG